MVKEISANALVNQIPEFKAFHARLLSVRGQFCAFDQKLREMRVAPTAVAEFATRTRG